MSDKSEKNTEEEEVLEVIDEIDTPNVKLNKNGRPRKELSPEQKLKNIENLAKARAKALVQKKALSSKSKAEQEQAKKARADKLAESKLKKAEDRKQKDDEIAKYENKDVEEKHVEEVVPKPKPKAVRKKQTRIILEQDSSESEPEEIVVRTRKTKKPVVVPVEPPVVPVKPPVVPVKVDHVTRVEPVPVIPAYTPEEIAKLKKQKETFEREQRRKLSLMSAIFN